MTDAELQAIPVKRMTEKDFRERWPSTDGGDWGACSTGLAVWEEARRARDSESALLAEVERLRGEAQAERALCQELADEIQQCKAMLGGPTHIGETLADIIRRSPVPEKP